MLPIIYSQNRYLGNRFSRTDLYLFLLIIFLNVFSVIGGILFVEYGIPYLVQQKADSIVQKVLDGTFDPDKQIIKLKNLKLDVNLGQFNADSIPVNYQVSFDAPSILPGSVSIGPYKITPTVMQQGKPDSVLADVTMGEMKIVFNQNADFKNTLQVKVNNERQSEVNNLFKSFVMGGGLKGATASARMTFPLSMFGVPIYQAFPLNINIPLGDVPSKLDVGFLLDRVAKARMAQKPVEASPPREKTESQKMLSSKFKQVLSAGPGLDLAFKDIEVSLKDEGIRTTITGSYSNPLPIKGFSAEIAKIDEASGYGSVEGNRAIKVGFTNLGITKDPIQNIDLGIDFKFVDSLIKPGVNGSANFGVSGPFRLGSATFVENASSEFKLPIVIPSDIVAKLRQLQPQTPNVDVMALLKNLTISDLNVGVEKSSLKVDMNLPPLPINAIKFLHTASIDAMNGKNKMFTGALSDLSVVTSDTSSKLGVTLKLVDLNFPNTVLFGGSVLGLADSAGPLTVGNVDLNDGDKKYAFVKQIPIKQLQLPVPTLSEIMAAAAKNAGNADETLKKINTSELLKSVSINGIDFKNEGGMGNFAITLPLALSNSVKLPYNGFATFGLNGKTFGTFGLKEVALDGGKGATKFSTTFTAKDLTFDTLNGGAGLISAIIKSKPSTAFIKEVNVADGKNTQVLAKKPVSVNIPTELIHNQVVKLASSANVPPIDPAVLMKSLSLAVDGIKVTDNGGQAHFSLTLPAFVDLKQISLPFSGGLNLNAEKGGLASVDVSNISVVGGQKITAASTFAVSGISLDSFVAGSDFLNSILKSKATSLSFSEVRGSDGKKSGKLEFDKLDIPVPATLRANIEKLGQMASGKVDPKAVLQTVMKNVKLKVDDVQFQKTTGDSLVNLQLPSLGDFNQVRIPFTAGLTVKTEKGVLSSFSVSNFSLGADSKGTSFGTKVGIADLTLDSIMAGADMINNVVKAKPSKLSFGTFFAADSKNKKALPLDSLEFTVPGNLLEMVKKGIQDSNINVKDIGGAVDVKKIASSFVLNKFEVAQSGANFGFNVDLPALPLVNIKEINIPYSAGLSLSTGGKTLGSGSAKDIKLVGKDGATRFSTGISVGDISLESIVGGAGLLNSVLTAKGSSLTVGGFNAADGGKSIKLPLEDLTIPIPQDLLMKATMTLGQSIMAPSKSMINPADLLKVVQLDSVKFLGDGLDAKINLKIPSGGGNIASLQIPASAGLTFSANNNSLGKFAMSDFSTTSKDGTVLFGTTFNARGLSLKSISAGASLLNSIITQKPGLIAVGDFYASAGNKTEPLPLSTISVPLPPTLLDTLVSMAGQLAKNNEGPKIDPAAVLKAFSVSNINLSPTSADAEIRVNLPGGFTNIDAVKLPVNAGLSFIAAKKNVSKVSVSDFTFNADSKTTSFGTKFSLANIGLDSIVGVGGLVGNIIGAKPTGFTFDSFNAGDGKSSITLPLAPLSVALPDNLLQTALANVDLKSVAGGGVGMAAKLLKGFKVQDFKVKSDGGSMSFTVDLPGFAEIKPVTFPYSIGLDVAGNGKRLSSFKGSNLAISANKDVTTVGASVALNNINLESVTAGASLLNNVLTNQNSTIAFNSLSAADQNKSEKLDIPNLNIPVPGNILSIALSAVMNTGKSADAPKVGDLVKMFSFENVKLSPTSASLDIKANFPGFTKFDPVKVPFTGALDFSSGNTKVSTAGVSNLYLAAEKDKTSFGTSFFVNDIGLNSIVGVGNLLGSILSAKTANVNFANFVAGDGQKSANLNISRLNFNLPDNLLQTALANVNLNQIGGAGGIMKAAAGLLKGFRINNFNFANNTATVSFSADLPGFADIPNVKFPYALGLDVAGNDQKLTTFSGSNLAISGNKQTTTVGATVSLKDINVNSIAAGAGLINNILNFKNNTVTFSSFTAADKDRTETLKFPQLNIPLPGDLLNVGFSALMNAMLPTDGSRPAINPADLAKLVKFDNINLTPNSASFDINAKVPIGGISLDQVNLPFTAGLNFGSGKSDISKVSVSNIKFGANKETVNFGTSMNIGNIGLSSIIGVTSLAGNILSAKPTSFTFGNFFAGQGQKSTTLPLSNITVALPDNVLSFALSNVKPLMASNNVNIASAAGLIKQLQVKNFKVNPDGVAFSFSADLPGFANFKGTTIPLGIGLDVMGNDNRLASFSGANLALSGTERATTVGASVQLRNINLDSIQSGASIINSVLTSQGGSIAFSKFTGSDQQNTASLSLPQFTVPFPKNLLDIGASALMNAMLPTDGSRPAINVKDLAKAVQFSNIALSPNSASVDINANLPIGGILNIDPVQLPFSGGLSFGSSNNTISQVSVSKLSFGTNSKSTSFGTNLFIGNIGLSSIVGVAGLAGNILGAKSASFSFSNFNAAMGQQSVNLKLSPISVALPPNTLSFALSQVQNMASNGGLGAAAGLLKGVSFNNVKLDQNGASFKFNANLPGFADFKGATIPLGIGLDFSANNQRLTSFKGANLGISGTKQATSVSADVNLLNIDLGSIMGGAGLINNILTYQKSNIAFSSFNGFDSKNTANLAFPDLTVPLPGNLLDIAASAVMGRNAPAPGAGLGGLIKNFGISNFQFQNGAASLNVNAALPPTLNFNGFNVPFGFGVNFAASNKTLVTGGASNIALTSGNNSTNFSTRLSVSGLSLDTIVGGASLVNSVLNAQGTALSLNKFTASNGSSSQTLPLSQFNVGIPSNLLSFGLTQLMSSGVGSGAAAGLLKNFKISGLNFAQNSGSAGVSLTLPAVAQFNPINIPGGAFINLQTPNGMLARAGVTGMQISGSQAGLQVSTNVVVSNVTLDSISAGAGLLNSVITQQPSALVFSGASATDGQRSANLPINPVTVSIPPNLLDIAASNLPAMMQAMQGAGLGNVLKGVGVSNFQFQNGVASVNLNASLPPVSALNGINLPFGFGVNFATANKTLVTGSASNLALTSANGATNFGTKITVSGLSLDTIVGGSTLVNSVLNAQSTALSLNNFFATAGNSKQTLPLSQFNFGIPSNLLAFGLNQIMTTGAATAVTNGAAAGALRSLKVSNIALNQNGGTAAVSLTLPALAQFNQINIPGGASINFQTTNNTLARAGVTGMSLVGTPAGLQVSTNVVVSNVTLNSVAAGAGLINSVLTQQPTALVFSGASATDGQRTANLPINPVTLTLPSNLLDIAASNIPRMMQAVAGSGAAANLLNSVKLGNLALSTSGVSLGFAATLPIQAGVQNSPPIPVTAGLNVVNGQRNLATGSISGIQLTPAQGGLNFATTVNAGNFGLDTLVGGAGLINSVLQSQPGTVTLANFFAGGTGGNQNNIPLPLSNLNINIPQGLLQAALQGAGAAMANGNAANMLRNLNPQFLGLVMGTRGPELSFSADLPVAGQFPTVQAPFGFEVGILPSPQNPNPVANGALKGLSATGMGQKTRITATVAANDITLDSAVRFSPTVGKLANVVLGGLGASQNFSAQKPAPPATLSAGQFSTQLNNQNVLLPLNELDLSLTQSMVQNAVAMLKTAGGGAGLNIGQLLGNLSVSNVNVNLPNINADVTLKMPPMAKPLNLNIPASASLDVLRNNNNLATASAGKIVIMSNNTATMMKVSVGLAPKITLGNAIPALGLLGQLVGGSALTVTANNFVANDGRNNQANLTLGRIDAALPPINIGQALTTAIRGAFGL